MSDPFRLGPALAFGLHATADRPSGDWEPLTTRISDPALHARVERVRDALWRPGHERVDARTAASTEQFGLAARLVSAYLCTVALGQPLDLQSTSIWWRQDETGWVGLSFSRTATSSDPLRDGAIVDLTERVQQLYGVSPHVLWGNLGSAANSTLTLLRTARPDLVTAARNAADRLLADPRVDGGTLRAGEGFRRRSCCLIYRATESLCGDCVLQSSGAARSCVSRTKAAKPGTVNST